MVRLANRTAERLVGRPLEGQAVAALGLAELAAIDAAAAEDAAIRDRVQLQLNRGESRHELARRLFFANPGAFQTGDYEEIMNKVSALLVLSNAVLVWNIVRMTDIVRALKTATGAPADPTDLARISRWRTRT